MFALYVWLWVRKVYMEFGDSIFSLAETQNKHVDAKRTTQELYLHFFAFIEEVHLWINL